MIRRRAARLVLPALCLVGTLGFGALGVWQVERLRWKRELIAQVDTRLAAPSIAVPGRATWRPIDPRALAYRRVRAVGTYLHDKETLVQALTERGGGYWVMTPLRTSNGLVLVNRGFVPAENSDPRTRAAGQLAGAVLVDGLLRSSEPGGRFLRPNRPGEGRWYSRDVAAMTQARGLGKVAPFFIDAGPAPNPGGLPVGGLTVVRFRNAHLVYALTWFALAGLSLFGFALTVRGSPRKSAGTD